MTPLESLKSLVKDMEELICIYRLRGISNAHAEDCPHQFYPHPFYPRSFYPRLRSIASELEKQPENFLHANHYAILDMVGSGMITGNLSEWPQVKAACKFAASELAESRTGREAVFPDYERKAE